MTTGYDTGVSRGFSEPPYFPAALWSAVAVSASNKMSPVAVTRKEWKTWALGFACFLFAINTVHEWAAVRAFETHVAEMAGAGGGVLFVVSPADCLTAADVTTSLVTTLSEHGVGAKGLVVRDGVAPDGLALVLEAANRRFPHVAVGARGSLAFVGRAGTPMILAVREDGVVAVMERLGVSGIADAPALAQRLLSALELH